ncbi:transmembrane protein 150C isoform X2 [Gasterosteus aculeatus]
MHDSSSVVFRGGRMWTCSPWALLPPIYSLLTAAGLWAVYFLAVDEEKIVPLGSKYRGNGSFYPPYISIAGNFPPASCIFSEVMNLASFVGEITMQVPAAEAEDGQTVAERRQPGGFLRRLLRDDARGKLPGDVNTRYVHARTRLFDGWFWFQLFTEETMHNFGTFLTFILGTLFCWVQSYVTLRVNLRNEGRKAAALRFLLSGSITLCMILYFSLMAQGLHVHAAQCQWALVMFFLAFLATFAIEFRHSHFQVVCTERSASRHQPDGL